jgi:ABC-type uncharacterized transport system ATPase subunit
LHDGIAVLDGLLSDVKKQRTDSYRIEFEEKEFAEKCAGLFADAELSENTVIIKQTAGKKIIKILAESGFVPVKFELLEPTLEDLFLQTIRTKEHGHK